MNIPQRLHWLTLNSNSMRLIYINKLYVLYLTLMFFQKFGLEFHVNYNQSKKIWFGIPCNYNQILFKCQLHWNVRLLYAPNIDLSTFQVLVVSYTINMRLNSNNLLKYFDLQHVRPAALTITTNDASKTVRETRGRQNKHFWR